MAQQQPTGAYSDQLEKRLMKDLFDLGAKDLTLCIADTLINERRRLAREVAFLRIMAPANRITKPERRPHA